MKTNLSPQATAATALAQLVTEHPELAECLSWTIHRLTPNLVGYIHDGGMRVLADCAQILGGSIRAADRTHKRDGVTLRQHVLSAVWRDVPVEVMVSVPVAAEAGAA